jgi:hypothetical protein
MSSPNVFVRLVWSIVIFLRFLFDGRFAGQVLEAWKGKALPAAPPPAPGLPVAAPAPKPAAAAPPPAPKPPDNAPALHLLAILQREGRLVDFLKEDITSFGDADVGAAARVVHDGCRRVLSEYVSLEPLRTEGEGARVTVEPGFDAAAVRLTGQVTGQPPFTGALRHHGWKATQVCLPPAPANVDPAIVAPAEVEL